MIRRRRFDAQKDAQKQIFLRGGCAGEVGNDVEIAVFKRKVRVAVEQPDEHTDADDAGKIAQCLAEKAGNFPLPQHIAHGDGGVVEQGIQKDARREHMDDAEQDGGALHAETVDQTGDAGDAARHQRERDKAAEIAARERARDAAQHKKRRDDEKAGGLAKLPVPVRAADLFRARKKGGAEHFVDEGQNAPHTVHTVVEHHQHDADAAREVEFPKPLFGAAAKAPHHAFIPGAAGIFYVDT